MKAKKTLTTGLLILCLVTGLCNGSPGFCAVQQDKTEGSATDSDGSTGSGLLIIDNQNMYEGMDDSYSRGYTPKIDGTKAVVVLPLLAKRNLKGKRMTASLRFGDSENLPFVQKNYEKAVTYDWHKTRNKTTKSGCYLITFSLELKKQRYNGNYPVTITVTAEDEKGNEVCQEFTVYVVITDGKDSDEQGKSESSDTGSSTGLVIENQHKYKGMAKSYARGYTPKTDGKKAVVVLPLRAKRRLAGSRLTAALKTGESDNQPFVQKNQEKTVKYNKKSGCYLVSFHLKLKKQRYNGSYPVNISVSAEDKNGNEIRQDFTIYVTITDGRSAEGDSGAKKSEDKIQLAPKVRMSSYQFSRDKILCGEKFTAKITLFNTSKTEMVRNMMVTVAPGENVELLGKTASAYVEKLGSSGTCEVSFDFRVSASSPRGQYGIGVTLEYADSRGGTYTVQESVKVSAEQKVRIGIDPVQVPKEIQLGDTVLLQTQAMNLGRGKIHNVRAVLEADGLTPAGSAFMGDAEAGTSLAGSLEVVAEGLSGDSLYGSTRGKVVFYYEDETGHEMTEEQTFETAILSPLKEDSEEKPEDQTGQWWVIMGVIVSVLAAAAVVSVMKKKKDLQKEEGNMDE